MIKYNYENEIILIRDDYYSTAEVKKLLKQLEKQGVNVGEELKEIGNSRKYWEIFYTSGMNRAILTYRSF